MAVWEASIAALMSWYSFSRMERDRTETMFSWASLGGIERTSGIIQERIASLARILRETSLPCTQRQSPLRSSPMLSRTAQHEEILFSIRFLVRELLLSLRNVQG